MGKIIFKKLLMIFYYIISAVILELITFNLLNFGFAPKYFLYDLSIIVFFSMIVFVIPNFKAQYYVATSFLLIQVVFLYTNYSLINIFKGELFSFDLLNYAAEATAAVTTSFVYISIILQLLTTFLIIAIVGYYILKYCKKVKINIKQHYSAIMVTILLIMQIFSSFGYFISRESVVSETALYEDSYVSGEKFLMKRMFLKQNSYKAFGTFGYFVNMIINNFEKNSISKETILATLNYFNNGNVYDGHYLNSENNMIDSKYFGVDSGNNVLVIMMESLEWFGFGDGTYDRNLDNLSYELTPNVYALIKGEDYITDLENENKLNDSIIASNFFAKSKTNISEGFGIIGSYPIGKSLDSLIGKNYQTSYNSYAYAMPNVLKSKGYSTHYFHTNEINFYKRGSTHKNLGFETVVGKDGILDENGKNVYTDYTWGNWTPEGEIVKSGIKYIIPKDYKDRPFYSFYLNVSSHGSYIQKDNKNDGDVLKYSDYVKYGLDDCVLDENNRYVLDRTITNPTKTEWYTNVLENYGNDKDLVDMLVIYQCGVCGLDEAIGVIINEMKEKKYDDDSSVYDHTTMLLYSDHNAYFNNISNEIKNTYETNNFIELNTIPMILSSPGIKLNYPEENLKYERFCSAYDIVPTLFDLLGISYNERFYIGNSLFKPMNYSYSVNDNKSEMVVYYSNTGGIYSLDMYSYNLSDYYFQNNELDEDATSLFNLESYSVLTKINYLDILNCYYLYNQLKES